MRSTRCFLIFFFTLFISCNEVLVHDLSENDANKIVSDLHKNEIKAKKLKQADGFWSVTVSKSESYKALEYLTSTRIIKSEHASKASSSSFINSREDQLFQYERHLSSEIEYTLKSLPGVLDVRVHLNLPVKDPLFGKNISDDSSSSGSVLLITGQEFLSKNIDIQKLVSGASGINPDLISVLIQKSKQSALLKVASKKKLTKEQVSRALFSNFNIQIAISLLFLLIFFISLKTRRDKLKLKKLKTMYASN